MSAILSLDLTSLLLGGAVLMCLLWWLSTRRPSGLPPGPGPALPLLGHLHLLAKDPRLQFRTWRRQYGDVFSLYMGGKLVVVLASYSAIYEAFVTFADVFSDRPHTFLTDHVRNKKGIGFTSGHLWKEQRDTALRILNSMGLGKNVLADKIQEEVTHYISAIKDYHGAPVDLARMTEVTISNNICSILFGKRYGYEDPEFISYLELVHHMQKLLSGTAMLNILPVLEYVPGDPFSGRALMVSARKFDVFINKHIAGLKGTDEEKENPEDADFISRYLRMCQKKKAEGVVDTTLNEENLTKSLVDLFAGGTDTTSAGLLWALLFFLHYPHVQEKCFKEISDVIGTHRPPTMRDKPDMTYLEAMTLEVLRKADIVPFAAHHTAAHDIMFQGYDIPKDAIVIPDLSGVLQDPDIWGDPENFRPERFIGPDGKVTRPKEFIPFSIGRRVCLAESMAHMELFLYLTTLIQHFQFLPPEDGQLPSLKGVFGLTHPPQPYKIRAVPRM